MIRILQRTKLSLKKNLFSLFQCIPQIKRNITYIWLNHFLIFHHFFKKLLRIKKWFMI